MIVVVEDNRMISIKYFLQQTVDGALAGNPECRQERSGTLPLGGGRRLRGYLARVEREGVRRVRMFLVITAAYILFWGPLFLVTLLHHPALTTHIAYEVSKFSENCGKYKFKIRHFRKAYIFLENVILNTEDSKKEFMKDFES